MGKEYPKSLYLNTPKIIRIVPQDSFAEDMQRIRRELQGCKERLRRI